MKIGIVGPAHPLRGGLSTFNERLAREFQNQGHEVILYSFSLQYPDFVFPGTTQYSSDPAPKDLTIKSIINSVNPLNWIVAALKIKKDAPDLLIVRYWLPLMGPALGSILRWCKKKNQTKIIVIADNIVPHEKRFGDKLFTKYFLPVADAFVCMSKDVMEDLKKLTTRPARFLVHPLYDNFGIKISKPEACQKLNIDENGLYILFFGFIRRYKGLMLLIEAMADERIKAMGIKLMVAGEYYEDSKPYESLIERLQIEEALLPFTTFIPNEEVRNYFCAADLIVQPYTSATQSGITQIAYHFDKPMVVTKVGGLAENVPHLKVGYVTDANATAIADAIVKFFTEKKSEEFSQNAAVEKSKYGWEIFTRHIFELLETTY